MSRRTHPSRAVVLVLRSVLAYVVILALGLSATPAAATDEPKAPLGTGVAELPGVTVIERVIAGDPLAGAVLPASLGHGLAVLLVPEGADEPSAEPDRGTKSDKDDKENGGLPRQLWALYGEASRAPELLADGLPGTLGALELHRGTGGRPDELWLGGDGVIYRYDLRTRGVEPILAAPGLDLEVLEQTGLLNVDGGVAIPELGRLRIFDADLRETAVVPVPVTAERRRSGLVLSSPHVVRPRAEGMPFFVGPEAQGTTRLLVRRIDPAADPAAGSAKGSSEESAGVPDPSDEANDEAWIRLPSPEDVERSKYVVLDGVPRLVVTTTDAETLGVFEEMGLRLYALRPDRTRGGASPLLEVQTKTKHWYTVGIEVADLDGDGRDDLALLQPEGMGAGDLLMDVYLGLGDGRVALGGQRRSKLDAPDARWHWGDDFTGDGVPDLFVASRERVELRAGERDHRRRAVEKSAAWEWEPEQLQDAMRRIDGENGPTPSGHYRRLGRVRAHDADGDGDLDLSLATGSDDRVIVRFVLPARP